MAQSTGYRILSVFLLLAIVVPVIPVSASFQNPPSPRAGIGPAEVAPAAAGAPDFTVPRPAEGQDRSQVAGSGIPVTARQGNTGVAASLGQGENDLLAHPPEAPLQSGEQLTLTGLPTPFIYVADSSEDAGGVWRSLDLGETWQHFTVGLDLPSTAFLIEAAQSNPSIVYLGTYGDSAKDYVVYRSTDFGETWTGLAGIPLQYPPPSGPEVSCAGLTIHPASPDILSVLVTNSASNELSAIYRTTDGGSSWVTATISGTQGWFSSDYSFLNNFNRLAQDAKAPQNLLAALLDTRFTGFDYLYLRSDNGGVNWEWMDAPQQTDDPESRVSVEDFAIHSGIALLGHVHPDDAAIYRADGLTSSWTPVLTPTGVPGPGVGEYQSVAIDPFDVGVYYALNQQDQILRSVNSGISWTVLHQGYGWWGQWEQLVLSFSREGLLATNNSWFAHFQPSFQDLKPLSAAERPVKQVFQSLGAR